MVIWQYGSLLWCSVQSFCQAVQRTVQSRQSDFEEANLQLQKLAAGDAQQHQLAPRYETLLRTCKVSHFGCRFPSLVAYYIFLFNSKYLIKHPHTCPVFMKQVLWG